MKISLAGLVILAAVAMGGTAPVGQDHPALRIRIAVPQRSMVAVRDKHSHFDVVMENVSDKPLKIIDEWNSWGYDDLRFEFTLPTGAQKKMEKLGRAWDKNFLTTTTLKPGEVTVWEVAYGRCGVEQHSRAEGKRGRSEGEAPGDFYTEGGCGRCVARGGELAGAGDHVLERAVRSGTLRLGPGQGQ